jgi:hypothetical protein
MPLRRNVLFVGRQADLSVIAAGLKGGATGASGQIAAITGLGGIGKTQLASRQPHQAPHRACEATRCDGLLTRSPLPFV